MAKVWCLVLVLIYVHNSLAHICGDTSKIASCDECIRCGNKWCSQEKVNVRCSYADKDDWCAGEPESLHHIQPQSAGGRSLHPAYMERTVLIGGDDSLPFSYKSEYERNVSITVYNTTQNWRGVELFPQDVECSAGVKGSSICELNIVARVDEDFCTSTSTQMEYIYASVKVEGISEEAVIKYHVPCACECTKKSVHAAPHCSGNGRLTCGLCYCEPGWKGARCEKSDCPDRGDVPSTCHDLGCSGNGFCGPCGNCICYKDREGSQYFNENNLCSDICMLISEEESECGPCLTTSVNGTCPSLEKSECHHRVNMPYDKQLIEQSDSYDRKLWVKCSGAFEIENQETIVIEYFAMKEEDTIRVMVVGDGFNSQGVVNTGAATTKVPIIMAVLGILAAIAAVGGVLLWRHLQAAPPLPFASPDYQNIDAEDCVGENPLYKPPTSTFTNPQYGKC